MDPDTRRAIEDAGFRVTSTQEFLGLTDEEIAAIEELLKDEARMLAWLKGGLSPFRQYNKGSDA